MLFSGGYVGGEGQKICNPQFVQQSFNPIQT